MPMITIPCSQGNDEHRETHSIYISAFATAEARNANKESRLETQGTAYAGILSKTPGAGVTQQVRQPLSILMKGPNLKRHTSMSFTNAA